MPTLGPPKEDPYSVGPWAVHSTYLNLRLTHEAELLLSESWSVFPELSGFIPCGISPLIIFFGCLLRGRCCFLFFHRSLLPPYLCDLANSFNLPMFQFLASKKTQSMRKITHYLMFTLPLTPHANSLGNKGFSETRCRLILRGRDSVSLAAKSSPRAVIPGQFTSAGLPVPSSLWATPP